MEGRTDGPVSKFDRARRARLTEGMIKDVLSGERDREVVEIRAEQGLGPWHELPAKDLPQIRYSRLHSRRLARMSDILGPKRAAELDRLDQEANLEVERERFQSLSDAELLYYD